MPKLIGSEHLFRNGEVTVNSSVIYLGLIHSVLAQCSSVVDVGCGRGAYAEAAADQANLFDLRGPGRLVLGLDVDPAGAENPFVDQFKKLSIGSSWPVEDTAADLVVSDWTLEHLEHPEEYIREVSRCLRPGGMFVARSVNYYSPLSLISRLIPNERHAKVLRSAQPTRKSIDVFPAFYRMNTPKAIRELLGDRWEYSLTFTPGLKSYLPRRFGWLARIITVIEHRLPGPTRTVFVLCARLKPSNP